MREDTQATITVSGKGKARLDVFGREIGKIIQNFWNGHLSTEVVKISATAMRVPRMQGLPLRMRGSRTMRSL